MRPRQRSALRLLVVTAMLAALAGCAAVPTAAVPAATTTAAPTPPPPTPRELAALAVADMSPRDRIASLLVLHSPGTDPAAMAAFVAAYRPGGVILMSDNIGESTDAVAAIASAAQSAAAGAPLLLAVDEEGGDVSRLPGDGWAAGRWLHDAPAAGVADAFTLRAQLVASSGLNLNFGVVADVTADAGSFIFSRTLGATPQAAAERVAAAVRAERAVGVLSTLKHFPGHGAAPGDSHTSVPATALAYDAWLAADAVPFRAGVDAGAEVVMFGHLVYTSVDAAPASLSAAWQRILRTELGFDGVTVTDDMGMLENSGDPAYVDRVANAVRSLDAGMTMLLFVADGPAPMTPDQVIDGLLAAVADGRLSQATIDDAAARALELRLTLGG